MYYFTKSSNISEYITNMPVSLWLFASKTDILDIYIIYNQIPIYFA